MIGERLKELRQRKNLTITQLSEILEMKPYTYIKYERNERDVSTSLLIKFSQFYCVPTDYLLGLAPEPDVLNEVANKFNMSVLEKEIISKYLVLPKSHRDELMKLLNDSVENANDNKDK